MFKHILAVFFTICLIKCKVSFIDLYSFCMYNKQNECCKINTLFHLKILKIIIIIIIWWIILNSCVKMRYKGFQILVNCDSLNLGMPCIIIQ